MKQLAFLSLAALLFFSAGCKKNYENNDTGSVIGNWELRYTEGGEGIGFGEKAPGNGYIIEFKDSTYKFIEHGQVKVSGTYELLKGSFTNREVTVPYKIVYDKNPLHTNLVSITSNKIILYGLPVASDGVVAHYARL